MRSMILSTLTYTHSFHQRSMRRPSYLPYPRSNRSFPLLEARPYGPSSLHPHRYHPRTGYGLGYADYSLSPLVCQSTLTRSSRHPNKRNWYYHHCRSNLEQLRRPAHLQIPGPPVARSSLRRTPRQPLLTRRASNLLPQHGRRVHPPSQSLTSSAPSRCA